MLRTWRRKICFTLAFIFWVFLLASCSAEKASKNSVMEIDGLTVARSEYEMIIASCGTQESRRYSTAEVNREDFWTSGEKGDCPVDRVMDMAEEELVRKKVIAHMADDAGIETATDYDSILSEMEAQNHSNSDENAAGEKYYGLTSYEIEDYYSYIYSKAEAELLEYLKQKYEVTEEEINREYEENRDSYGDDGQSVEERKGIVKNEIQTRLAKEEIEKNVESADIAADEDELRKIALNVLEK